MKAAIHFEGGGHRNKALQSKAREAMSRLLTAAGLAGRLPRLVVCGPRHAAFEDFVQALERASADARVYLLVDAEAAVDQPVDEAGAWAHVAARPGDRWARPAARHDDHLHLMVQMMESWFLADRDALAAYFGPKFDAKKLPAATRRIGAVAKSRVESALAKAASATPKGGYDKGRDAFDILGRLDPARIAAACPWAERFFSTLKRDL